MKNLILETPIIPQTFNINYYRTTSANSMNLDMIRKLFKQCLRKVLWKQCLLSPFLRYCCSNVGRYYDPHSGLQGAKGLRKYFSCLLADQILQSSCPYSVRYWAICVLQLFVIQIVTSWILKLTLSFFSSRFFYVTKKS